MSEVPNPEIRTRLEYQGITDGVYQFPSLSVKAIPWCTTHDSRVEDDYCHHADRSHNIGDCIVSTGGPEHKWWMDL